MDEGFQAAWRRAVAKIEGRKFSEDEITKAIDNALFRSAESEEEEEREDALAELCVLCGPTGFDAYEPIVPGDQVGIAFRSPKTAALSFDKIWAPFRHMEVTEFGKAPEPDRMQIVMHTTENYIPPSIRCYHGSIDESFVLGHLHATIIRGLAEAIGNHGQSTSINDVRLNLESYLSEILSEGLSANAVPMFLDRKERKAQYREGDRSDIVQVLSTLPIPLEESLEWEQVLEFRADAGARTKYRAFVHWLDEKMAGRSISFIQDAIHIRHYEYKRALRKHGIRTNSTLSDCRAALLSTCK
ncbi:MAG TPA: hypothetical protein VEW48_05570 [Thermoanaerobaculia bacterium]|nr:hypothetical protein [Thermoanaerobaculia bacterium]